MSNIVFPIPSEEFKVELRESGGAAVVSIAEDDTTVVIEPGARVEAAFDICDCRVLGNVVPCDAPAPSVLVASVHAR